MFDVPILGIFVQNLTIMVPQNDLKKQCSIYSCFCCFNKIRYFLIVFAFLAVFTIIFNTWVFMTFPQTTFRLSVPQTTNRTRIQERILGPVSKRLDANSVKRTTKSSNGFKQNQLNNCSEDFKRRHLMTISYSGRTGNLLFQLASLIAISSKTCYTPICMPKTIPYLDPIFDIRHIERRPYNHSSFKELEEHGHATYDVNITSRITPEYNWILGGYRQSYHYFKDYADLIRSSFRFKDIIKQDVRQYMNSGMYHTKPTVCLQVRRGDIVVSKQAGVSNMSYINRSINYLKKHISPKQFSLIVVSDGMSWCKQNIQGDYVRYSPFQDAGRDLYLLTQCDHSILTIGTFGWMGAWLNETGLVIYDKLARRPEGMRISDHFFSHWIGL